MKNPTVSLLEKVQALNKEKKFQEVIDALSGEVLAEHNSADLYAEKAQAYYHLGHKDESKKMTELALLIQPGHAKGNIYLGNWYLDRNEFYIEIGDIRPLITKLTLGPQSRAGRGMGFCVLLCF